METLAKNHLLGAKQASANVAVNYINFSNKNKCYIMPLTIKFDKKQKRCIKRIQLVADDGLHDHRKAFYKVKNQFYLQFTNDTEFTNF